ncbi:MAG: glycosyltransferase family 4 protein [Acidobacteriaceae bacterium]|nr:glycosyltransferase family 4 protein [Acidobacteriaceae bacterium]
MSSDVRSGRRPCPVLLMIREIDCGGSERQITEIAKSLDREQFTPHVGCFLDQGLFSHEIRAAGVPIVQFPVRSFSKPGTVRVARLMGDYLREHEIGIVHTFDVPSNVFGVFAARAYRTPIVISSQRAYRTLTTGAVLKLLRMTDRLVDRLVVNCEALRRHLMEEERVPSRLIRVCYNGLDTSRFHPAPRSRPPEVGDAAIVIGVACVLRPEKGLLTLVDAFARVANLGPNLKLLLVGSGPSRDEIVARCRERGIADRCVFVPAVSNVEEWLHVFDIFVLPSLSEALSNVLMEAMASGCAVIASRVGGNPELVTDGKTGFLFERENVEQLAAHMKRLIEHPELRCKIAGAGSQRIHAEFTRGRAIDRIQGIYSELIAQAN